MGPHHVPVDLAYSALALDNSVKNLPSDAYFIEVKVQRDTVLPHEHGAKDDVISVDVHHIEIVTAFLRTELKVSEESEVDLRTAAHCA